ncbi:MAG: hypothetical protein IT435_19905 [Phycisphaerales bacterium]|nr:hypothetical protein [Phycisphaerales bacterium]
MPETSNAARPASDKQPPRPRRRKWLIALIAIGLCSWLFTSSPLVRWVASSRLRAMTGVQLSQGKVSIGLGGHIAVTDAVVRAPGIDGPGGELMRIERLDAVVSWKRLLGFISDDQPALSDVMVLHPTLRLSQNATDGRLNLSSLRLPSSSGQATALPRVKIDGGIIEVGEHAGNASRDPFTLLKRIDVHGQLSPSTAREDGSFELVLTPDADAPASPSSPVEPVRITGAVQGSDLSLALTGLSLKDWPPSAMPSRIRRVAQMLDLEGAIGPATISYSPPSPGSPAGLRATADLIDVSVNLPITDDGQLAQSADAPLIRMLHVNGPIELSESGITAKLVGSIEEVPYRVDLKYQGSEPDSPFVCLVKTENFRMEKDLRILRFVPPLVRERLADFSWPTGLVASEVTVSRGEPVNGKAADLSVVGEMEVKEAVSAFKRFPYEFRNLSGRVKFTDTRIDILDIKGRSPAGATIRASGFIEPPTGDAHCVIDVYVQNMPVDADVIRAMAVRRKGIVPVLFNEDHYNRLLANGLIHRPGEPATQPGALPFALDGMAQVHTRVTRPAGPDTEWLEETSIHFDSLTILPEWFPLPMIATDVQVEVMKDNTMTIRGGEYRPIVGGAGTASADVDYRLIIDPARDGSPELTVNAKDIPTGRLVHYAIGATLDRASRDKPGSSAGPRLRGILDELHAAGLLSAELRLFNDDQDSGHVTATVNAGPLLLRPQPTDEPEGAASAEQLEVVNARGVVKIADREVTFDFSGNTRARDAGRPTLAEEPAPGSGGEIHVAGKVAPENNEPELRAAVDVRDIDLSLPIEQLVAVFSSQAAARWTKLSHEFNPTGHVGGRIEIGPSPDGTVATVTIERFEDMAGSVEGQTTRFDDISGSLRTHPGGEVEFRDFSARLRSGEQPLGTIEAAGSLRPDDQGDVVPAEGFKATLRNARAEANLLRAIAARRLSPDNAELLRSLNPRGEFDAQFEFKPGAGAAGAAGLEGRISPKAMTVHVRGQDVAFSAASGDVTFTSKGGQLRAIEGKGEGFDLRADGSWLLTPEDDVEIDLTLTGGSTGMPGSLRALLPASVDDVLAAIGFDVAGKVDLTVMQIRLTQSDAPTRQRLLAGGKVGILGGKLTVGAPVTDCDGRLDFRVTNSDFSTPAGFTITSSLDRFKIGGLGMENGIVEVQGRPETGEIAIPQITADCYGGKFAGRALIGPAGSASREFQASFELAGVRFAPTLRDLTASAGKPIDAQPPADTDASRGLVTASVSLGGKLDDPTSRRGIGKATIAGPSVLRMPLVMPLIEFSNLQLPTDEPLDFANSAFYIEGPVLAFEDLSVFSSNVHIRGFGTMTWPEMMLDLRFNSRAIKRIPVLNWLLEGLRDELVTTRVSGTLSEPDVASVPFDQTRRFFLDVFGRTLSEQDRRMLQLEKGTVNGSR